MIFVKINSLCYNGITFLFKGISMGSRLALQIKDKNNVIYMNTMTDGFPNEIIPPMKKMVQDWEEVLNNIEHRLSAGEFKAPLLSRWVPKMQKLLTSYKEAPSVEVASMLCAELSYHLFRYVGWNDDEKAEKSFPIYNKSGEIVYYLDENVIEHKKKPVPYDEVKPVPLPSNRKILRISYSEDPKKRKLMKCDFSVPAEMTQEDLNRYFQEINSWEAQMFYCASTSNLKNNTLVNKRFNERNFTMIYSTDKMSKEILGIPEMENSRLFDLMRSSGTGYYDLVVDTLGRYLCLVSAGEILPLNEANALWAKTQSSKNVAFCIKQYKEKPDNAAGFSFMVTQWDSDSLKERIEAFKNFYEFTQSVKPGVRILREFFDVSKNKKGKVDFYLTIDQIRMFEFFAKHPHEIHENLVAFEKSLNDDYTVKS